MLRLPAACAVLCVLLAGCGSSVISRVDREDSGPGFAQHVVKLSDAQNITEMRMTESSLHGVVTLWAVANHGFRESSGLSKLPVIIQAGHSLYIRFPVASANGPVTKPAGCYTLQHFSSDVRVSADVLPAMYRIYRVAGQTAYFTSTQRLAGAIVANGKPGAPHLGRVSEYGYFRFNSRGLATSEEIEDRLPGRVFVTHRTYSYPKAVPASVTIEPPANICKHG